MKSSPRSIGFASLQTRVRFTVMLRAIAAVAQHPTLLGRRMDLEDLEVISFEFQRQGCLSGLNHS